jgi:hypothetical protein
MEYCSHTPGSQLLNYFGRSIIMECVLEYEIYIVLLIY